MADTIYTLNGDDVLYFPFNAEQAEDGFFDRVWDATDFAKYFYLFVSDGVYSKPSTCLQVRENGGMSVKVGAGTAMARGHGYMQQKDIDVGIHAADSVLGRVDDVVVRLDMTRRAFYVVYRAGVPAGIPAVSELLRNDDIFELRLAEITVRAGAESISAIDIKDTRMDGDVCGFVTGVPNSVDTTTLFEQYDAFLSAKTAEWTSIQNEQQLTWEGKTENQQSAWLDQMSEQQISWDGAMAAWETWFATINIDLQTYATFDFDNLAALPGVTKVTTFSAGRMLEALTVTVGGARVAERDTDLNTLSRTETVYASGGGSVIRQTTITTVFDGGGIREVIV